jgi:hypothetical protein
MLAERLAASQEGLSSMELVGSKKEEIMVACFKIVNFTKDV